MDKGQAWVKHARGVARLIEHRGPERLKTEFEKSLLMTQLGIIVGWPIFPFSSLVLRKSYALHNISID
jgi:hypothetical protein